MLKVPSQCWSFLILALLSCSTEYVLAQDYFKALETGNTYLNQQIDRFSNGDILIGNSSLEALETGDEIGKITLLRIDGCGNELWSKIYTYTEGYLELKDVVVNDLNEVFIYGSHYKGLAEVIFIAKFDGLTGENMDFRLFDPGTVDHFSYTMDLHNGQIMVYGLLFDFNTAKLGFIAVFNENLAYLWSKRFEPFESTGAAIATSDNGFAGRSGPYLYKFDNSGTPQWSVGLESGSEILIIGGPIETNNGLLFEGHRNGESFFFKVDMNGQLLWQSDLFPATNQGAAITLLEDNSFLCTYNQLETDYTDLAQFNLSEGGSISNQRKLMLDDLMITGTIEQTLARNGVLTLIGNANPIALNPVDIQDFVLQFNITESEIACYDWEDFSELRTNDLVLNFNPIVLEIEDFDMEQENRLTLDGFNFEIPFSELCDMVFTPETIEIDTLIACDDEWWVTLPDSNFNWVDVPGIAPRLLELPGTYQARKQTCNDPVIINYTLSRPDCPCDIFLPNAFTPNSDGQNDLLELFSECPLDKVSATIYDRWGNLIHQSNQQSSIWDGTSRGERIMTGVYIIVIDYEWSDENGTKTERVAQSVTLVR